MNKLARRSELVLRLGQTLVLRSNKRRWRAVADSAPQWADRSRTIASFIPEGSSVVDMGAGSRSLQAALKPDCEYQACDIVASPGVILCDFNKKEYPSLKRNYDYVVCSGILEYMRDPDNFLRIVQRYGSNVLLTYNTKGNNSSTLARLARGWVNHFDHDALLETLRSAGLRGELLKQEGDELLFLFPVASEKTRRV